MHYLVALAIIYLLAWTVGYILVAGGDFHYYFTYWRMGLSGFEKPGFAHVFSVFATIVGFGLYCLGRLVTKRMSARPKE